MPLLKLHTNISKSELESKKNSIINGLYKIIEEELNKPSSYVMISLKGDEIISFASSDEKACYIMFLQLGSLTKDKIELVAGKIVDLLKSELSISEDRVYMIFNDTITRDHWVFGRKSF